MIGYTPKKWISISHTFSNMKCQERIKGFKDLVINDKFAL
jgi:hypothetical protein